MVTFEDMISNINFLLSELKLESNLSKHTAIDGLSDYIVCDLLPLKLKYNMVVEVISLFDRHNNYDLQESIFYFLGEAVYHVMSDRIIEFMVGYLADSPDPSMIGYALDTILGSDYINKKQVIQDCLNSPNVVIKEVTLKILKYAEDNGILY